MCVTGGWNNDSDTEEEDESGEAKGEVCLKIKNSFFHSQVRNKKENDIQHLQSLLYRVTFDSFQMC